MKKINNFSTFCSNLDAFYVPFLQTIDVYYDSNIGDVLDCESDYRGCHKISPLVACSRYYASDDLRSIFSEREGRDALIIHGTWHDEAEHSWWEYIHEMFPRYCRNSFISDMHYTLHGRYEVHSEFGMTLLSLEGHSEQDLLDAITGIYESVTVREGNIHFDDYKYERAILQLNCQSILEASWDLYPEILSGLTAAKYLPASEVRDVPFTFAVLITLCELLRLVGPARIITLSRSENPEVANRYKDLFKIAQNLIGGIW